jgi:glycosyltransferase involved in cell wall biosynthesis
VISESRGGPAVAVLIATYNRAALLRDTLQVLSASQVKRSTRWEVVVIDNNSTDATASVVASMQSGFPVRLVYLREPRQGRSAALNAGIAATTAPLLLLTDDDVRVDASWLDAGVRALSNGADYVGGPVAPRWEVPPPSWFDLDHSDLWGTLAILDYGDEPFDFDDRKRVPLGANMGLRRSLIERVGGFRVDLGRTGTRRLLGQEVPELLSRARAARLRGHYVPAMRVEHYVPAVRLTRAYFRRWWMGKGYSRALLEAMQPVTELGLDLRTVPHVGAIPCFMVTDALRDLRNYARAAFNHRRVDQVRYEMRLAYFIGFLRGRGVWRRPRYDGPPGRSGKQMPVPVR